MKKIILILVPLLFLTLISIYFFQSGFKFKIQNQTKEQLCIQNKGKWIQKYNECEFGGSGSKEKENNCKEMRGRYIDCASPCRHDPPGTICIQLCVPICTFNSN